MSRGVSRTRGIESRENYTSMITAYNIARRIYRTRYGRVDNGMIEYDDTYLYITKYFLIDEEVATTYKKCIDSYENTAEIR